MMYLAFCTHIIHIYIYIFKSSLYHCHILKNWWISRRCTCGFGRSYGVGLQPHSCCNADGSEALQPGRRQTWPEYRIYIIQIYIYIYYFLKCSINCFFGFTSALLHLSKAILFMLFICLYFIFVFWWFLHFFTTKLKCKISSHKFVATGPAREAATRKHSRRAKPTMDLRCFDI